MHLKDKFILRKFSFSGKFDIILMTFLFNFNLSIYRWFQFQILKRNLTHMKSFLQSSKTIKSLFQLQGTFHQQLLFLVSASLYNSLDYYFNQPSGSQEKMHHFFISSFLDYFVLNIPLCLITVISFGISLKILIQIFILRRPTYFCQIQQKIVFPIMVYLLAQMASKQNQNSEKSQAKILETVKVLFYISLIVCFVISNLINFRVNFRHAKNSKHQGFSTIYKFGFGLLQVKGLFSIIASFLLSTTTYLISICFINLVSNAVFCRRIFYENPKYEYLQMLTQIYMWIPVFHAFFPQNSLNSINIQIISGMIFIIYAILGLIKPECLMFFLEVKYRRVAKKFCTQIMQKKGDNNEIKGFQNKNQVTVEYLSILLSLSCKDSGNDGSSDGLQWSQNFRAQIADSFKFCVCQINGGNSPIKTELNQSQPVKTQLGLQSLRKSTKTLIQTLRFPHQNPSIKITEPHHHANTPTLSASPHSKALSIFSELENQVWSFILELVEKRSKSSAQMLLFLCYNLPSRTQIMKHRIFHLHFTNRKMTKGWFDKVDSDICYQNLLEIIAEQQLSIEMLQKACPSQQFCLSAQVSNFNTNFNQFFIESKLFNSILKNLSSFAKNQFFYLKIAQPTHQNKEQVLIYFRKRHSLRRQIQEQVKEYSKMNGQSNDKVHLSCMLAYIKDYWLNNDRLMAVKNFYKLINQSLLFKKSSIVLKSHLIAKNVQKDNNENTKKFTCVVSSISSPDKIIMSCSDFKKTMELDEESTLQAFKKSSSKNLNFQNKSKNHNTDHHEPTHFTKIHALILPIFRQQHQKIHLSTYIESPVDHTSKPHFLISKKQTTLLENRFKMFFHMLYENDLLIVLDIDSEKVQQLIVTDHDKQNVIFHHDGRKNFRQQRKRRVSTFKEEVRNIGAKDQSTPLFSKDFTNCYSQNDLLLNNTLKFTPIAYFNQQYQMSIKKQPQPSVQIDQDITQGASRYRHRATTALLLEKPILEKQQDSIQDENTLKEQNFHKYKKSFNEGMQDFFLLVGYKVVLGMFALVGLIVLIRQTHGSLQDSMQMVSDQMQLEEEYARQSFNRAIDIEMIANIYLLQINPALMKQETKTTLVSHILSSLTTNFDNMKMRHHVNPYLVRKSIKTDHFWDPQWINGRNISLQMMSYQTEMMFLSSERSFLKITELEDSNTSQHPTQPCDIKVQFKNLDFEMSMFEYELNLDYLYRYFSDQTYFLDSQNGVLATFRKNRSVLIEESQNKQKIGICILTVMGFVVAVINIALVMKTTRRICKKYQTAIGTSQQFIREFKKSNDQLASCIEEMKQFDKQKVFEIVNRKDQNHYVLKNKRIYKLIHSVTNIKQQSFAEHRQQQKAHFYAKVFPYQIPEFKLFKSSIWKYPIITSLIVIGSFSISFYNYQNKLSNLKTYTSGLDKLTSINLEFLSLMSENLGIAVIKSTQSTQEAYVEVLRDVIQAFKASLYHIATTNKINIFQQLFQGQQNQNQMVSKVLYSKICEQFPQDIDCPSYMATKIEGLYEKYGQTVKNIQVLFHNLIKSPTTIYGTLDTTDYQSRYINSYQNMNELLYVNKMIRKISFDYLQKAVGVTVSTSFTEKTLPAKYFSSTFFLILGLIVYLIVESVMFLFKCYKETKIVNAEFLRIGTFKMIENEKTQFNGYAKYVNLAQHQQYLPKD